MRAVLYWKKRAEETWGLVGDGWLDWCLLLVKEEEELYTSRTISSPFSFFFPSVSPLS